MSMTKALLGELPADIVPEAIVQMDKFNGMEVPTNRERFAEEFLSYLKGKYTGQSLEDLLQKLNLASQDNLLSTVDVYISLRRNHPGMAFHNDFLPRSGSDVTDMALFLIDNVVKKNRITDRFDIMSAVCDALENKFGDSDRLEANLDKMNLKTTDDILHAIDIYWVMRRLYPETVFGRERMRRMWADAV